MDTTAPRRGRPLGVNRLETTARQHEALSLVAALRVIAHDLETLAWRESAYQCLSQADRLRSVAERYERKWSEGRA